MPDTETHIAAALEGVCEEFTLSDGPGVWPNWTLLCVTCGQPQSMHWLRTLRDQRDEARRVAESGRQTPLVDPS